MIQMKIILEQQEMEIVSKLVTSVKESWSVHNADVSSEVESLLVVALLGDGAPSDRGHEVLDTKDLVAGVALSTSRLTDEHKPQLVGISHLVVLVDCWTKCEYIF